MKRTAILCTMVLLGGCDQNTASSRSEPGNDVVEESRERPRDEGASAKREKRSEANEEHVAKRRSDDAIPAPPDVAAPPADAERTDSGLASRVLSTGTGTEHPVAADTVTVHYSGWTTDGEMFDSSVLRGEPAEFQLNQVIKGWTEGLQLMVKGEKRRLWIPEELAYKGRPRRPRGMLVFDVELIEILE
jgi:peptidylprolyl isomerase